MGKKIVIDMDDYTYETLQLIAKHQGARVSELIRGVACNLGNYATTTEVHLYRLKESQSGAFDDGEGEVM